MINSIVMYILEFLRIFFIKHTVVNFIFNTGGVITVILLLNLRLKSRVNLRVRKAFFYRVCKGRGSDY